MFQISDDLKAFIESDIGVLIGTVDAHGHPQLAYAWGPRVHEGGRSLSVYADRERSSALLSGTDRQPQIAVTFTSAVSLRSIQIKGRFLGTAEPNDAERSWIERHHEAFATSTSLIGDPPHVIRNLWTQETVRVDLTAERAFDQTPGPHAGMPL
jgi:hypothetical protein